MSGYLIIGADAAGLSAASQIKRNIPDASLKVIDKGKIISYAACGIPYVISGDIESVENLVHFTPESIKEKKGISVETQREAIDIFTDEKYVKVKDVSTGAISTEKYEKLLIATGSTPQKLPFMDYQKEGIFNLHNLEDLREILSYIKNHESKSAAVIGAGNRGLELVEALRARKIEVRVFEILPEPATTWPSFIRNAIKKKIAEKNIEFSGETSVQEVDKTKKGFTVDTEKGPYECDMVFSVVGTKPATDFCQDKIKKMRNGALIIDRKGKTSVKDIYSAGDCASVYHRILDRNTYYPSGSTANKMGRIAGLNMSGEDILFPGIVGTQIFKFFELSLAKTGLSLEDAQKEGIEADVSSARRLDKAGYYPGAKSSQAEVVYDISSGKVLGASVVSEGNASQLIDPIAVAVYAGLSVKELGWFDSAYTPPYAPVWNAWVSASLKHTLD